MAFNSEYWRSHIPEHDKQDDSIMHIDDLDCRSVVDLAHRASAHKYFQCIADAHPRKHSAVDIAKLVLCNLAKGKKGIHVSREVYVMWMKANLANEHGIFPEVLESIREGITKEEVDAHLGISFEGRKRNHHGNTLPI